MAREKMLNVRASDEELQELDKLRRDEPDMPSRTTMMRRLLERAIEAHGTAKPAKRK